MGLHRTAVPCGSGDPCGGRTGTTPALVLALLLAAGGLTGGSPAIPSAVAAAPEGTVAVIGAETVSEDEYRQFLRSYVRSKLYHGGSKDRLHELANEALEKLVTDRLLAQEARRRGIAGDEAAVEKQIEALRTQYSGGENWPQIEPQLPAIAEKLRSDSQIEALKAEVTQVAPPTEDELSAFYEANLALFTQPAAWDLNVLLVGVPPSSLSPEWDAAKLRAESFVAELRSGESFEEVAAEHSSHESGKQGGHLGRVHSGQFSAEVQAAIARLSPGEVTDPLRVLEGFAIFRFNAEIPAETHPLDEVRERAEALFRRNTATERWQSLIADLRAKTHVETFDVSAIIEALVAGE